MKVSIAVTDKNDIPIICTADFDPSLCGNSTDGQPPCDDCVGNPYVDGFTMYEDAATTTPEFDASYVIDLVRTTTMCEIRACVR